MSAATGNAVAVTRRWSDAAAYRAWGRGDAIRTVLVLKVDHVGDFVLGLDALSCLRRSFPNAMIDLACGPWNVEIARSCELFDNIYPISFFNARADGDHPPFHPGIAEELGGKRWDLAVDLRIDPDTRVLLRHIDARWKMGFECGGMDDVMAMALPRFTPVGNDGNVAMHQSMLMLRLIHAVVDVFCPSDDVQVMLREHIAVAPGIDLSSATGRCLIVCNTSSGRLMKNWPLDRFRRLIAWLAADLDCVVVLVGDRTQSDDAAKVLAFSGSDKVISAVGRTTLREAIGIVAQASIYIGNDTGLTHVAARLGIPTVALFSGIDPAALFAPLGKNTTILTAPVPCSPCHLLKPEDCVAGHACVLNISETSVRAAVLNHLFAARAYDGPDGALASLPPPDARSTRGTRCDSAFKTWTASPRAETPQRYSQNLPRYLARSGHLDLLDLRRGFTKGNENNRGDLNRFHTLALVFDQIMKEQIRGDVAELGVYKGNTAYMLAQHARRTGATAYLLDTFEGFSPADLQGIDANKRMEFADTSLEGVRALVGSVSVQYVKGYFPETAEQIPSDATFSLVHIDCDLYVPFKAALEYFYPRLVPGGFMIMHDYSSLHWDGAERAVDEFFADKPESIVPVADGSGTVIIRRLGRGDQERNWFVQSKVTGFANDWVNANSHPVCNFLTRGWTAPESWGTWGIGDRHILSLLFLNPPSEIELAVESQLALLSGREQGWVDVYVGGQRQARWEYSLERNCALRTVRIRRSAMTQREDRLFEVDLEFRPDSSVAPHDLDPASSDTRPLGLGLLRFCQRGLDGTC